MIVTIVGNYCFGAGGVSMGVLVEAVWRMVLRYDWDTISGCSMNMMRLLRLKYNCCGRDTTVAIETRLLA